MEEGEEEEGTEVLRRYGWEGRREESEEREEREETEESGEEEGECGNVRMWERFLGCG